jgi:hypothetical protein
LFVTYGAVGKRCEGTLKVGSDGFILARGARPGTLNERRVDKGPGTKACCKIGRRPGQRTQAQREGVPFYRINLLLPPRGTFRCPACFRIRNGRRFGISHGNDRILYCPPARVSASTAAVWPDTSTTSDQRDPYLGGCWTCRYSGRTGLHIRPRLCPVNYAPAT